MEIRSALARLVREGAVSAATVEKAKARLHALRNSWHEILPSEHLRNLAEELAETYALRAPDSFQLAAAMAWCDERPRHRPFVCLDSRLANAAARAGFDVKG